MVVRFAGGTCLPVILLLSSVVWGDTSEMKVWAVGGNVRIDPISGEAREHRLVARSDSPQRDHRTSNLIWEADGGVVTLRAARNEIVSYQIIVERTGDAPLRNVSLELGDFRGPGGKKIPAENVDLYKEWYVQLKKPSVGGDSLGTGWYPDALLPTERWEGALYPRDQVLPLDVPDAMNNMGDRQRNHGLWVDVYVPRDRSAAPAGNYTSTVKVTSDAGSAVLTVNLQVWDFSLPDETHLAGNIHSDTEINTFTESLELKYYQLIRRHRLTLGVLGYAPEIRVDGTDVEIDWSDYDARLAKYLDGSAFTAQYGYRGPGEGVPIELLILPFDCQPMNLYKTSRGVAVAGKEFKFYRGWPVSIPKGGITEEYEEIFSNAFRAFSKHFEEHPKWNRTRPIVFFLSLDEAYDRASWEQMLFYAKLLEQSGADRLEFRIDGWYPAEAMDMLAPHVDIAILGGSVDTERIGGLRKSGVEDWFYVGVGNIDADLLGGRALSWFCWKYGVSSWTLWELDFNALRAWLYPVSYTAGEAGIHNGHGMLVYRGETMGLDQPVASIRLKALRRGTQDYEYLWLLSQTVEGRKEADQIVSSIILEPEGRAGAWDAWQRQSDAWEKARYQLGARIEAAGSGTDESDEQ